MAEPPIAGMMIMCDRADGRRGDRWRIPREELWHSALEALRGGAPLFLVDVRPETDLFLTAVIEQSRFDQHGWAGGDADVVLVDVGHLRSRLRFDTGMGVTGSKGFVWWLRTPRVLTANDVMLLREAMREVGAEDATLPVRPTPRPDIAPTDPGANYRSKPPPPVDPAGAEPARVELIALQRERARTGAPPSARERELIATHLAAWLGPLHEVVLPWTARFANGQLVACTLCSMAGTRAPAIIGHPLWRTVEEIECDDMAVLTHPVMAAMRRASLTGAALSALASRGGQRLEAVIGPTSGVHGQIRTGARIDEPSDWRDAFAVGCLTNLRELSVIAPADPSLLEPLVASPLAAQLRTLDIFSEVPPRGLVAAQLATLVAHPQLERITIRYTDVLRRRPAATHVIVELERAPVRRPPYRVRVQTTRCDVELLGSTINAFALELPPGLVLELEYIGDDPSELERFDDLAATIRVVKHFADVLVPEATDG